MSQPTGVQPPDQSNIATEDIDEDELDRQIEQYESGDSLPNLHRRSSASKLAVLVDNKSQQIPKSDMSGGLASPEPESDAKAIVAECRLGRFEVDARELASKYPPQFFHGNKKLLYELACPKGAASLSGTVTIARWGSVPLPRAFPAGPCCSLEFKEGPFEYFQSTADTVHWTANFADRHLFFAYGSSLFAQDEIQVAEHPVLASVREYMVAAKDAKVAPLTIDNGSESPVLIMGAERRVQVLTDSNPSEGRPYGLYGNNFAGANRDSVKKATRIIDPPIVSNIFAFTAPSYGAGLYTVKQLTEILCTAHSTFIAARLESYQQRSPAVPAIVIHTGNWGTGAFGGNKIIMALLQMAAARLALTGRDGAVHYTFSPDGTAAYRAASEVFKALVPDGSPVSVVDFIKKVHDLHYTWGHSNGT